MLQSTTLDELRAALAATPDIACVPFGRTTPPSYAEWSAHCGGRFDREWCIVIIHRHPRRGVAAQVRTHLWFDGLEMQMRTLGAREAMARGEMAFAPLDEAKRFCAWPSPESVTEALAHYEQTLALARKGTT